MSFRAEIEEIRGREPQLANDLLWNGATTAHDPGLKRLQKLGLIVGSRQLRAKRQVWLDDGRTIVTDRPDDRRLTRVFPLFSDEGLLLAKLVASGQYSTVLDIGTGSGIIAITGALAGASVVATDVNPRALAMASINARLNGVEEKVSLVLSDAFAGVPQGAAYDLIVANPPFAAIPPGCVFHQSGHGGPDGLAVIRRILARAAAYLAPKGVLVMLSMSLEGDDGPCVLALAREYLGPDFRLKFQRLYPESAALGEYVALFRAWSSALSWSRRLQQCGLTTLSFGVLIADRDNGATGIDDSFCRAAAPAGTFYSGGWAARFRRYRAWLSLFE